MRTFQPGQLVRIKPYEDGKNMFGQDDLLGGRYAIVVGAYTNKYNIFVCQVVVGTEVIICAPGSIETL